MSSPEIMQTIQPKSNNGHPIGAVLVVGGGIAGMQAALDLADQGILVYLVEKESAIGGHMAQLDKTFPTNDCAMCNISPKLVETGRHPNIKLLTNTDVIAIGGQVGNFNVKLSRRPRYIDEIKCIGCGECAVVCPISIPDLYERGMKTRKAVYRLYSQAVPSAYAIEKLGIAPCRDACPAGQRAQGYIALIAQGRYREALRVIKEENPFPSVCGRTCHHPCESSCARGLIDEPVSIMSLKRFVVDYAEAYGRERIEAVPRTRPEWVAIVGAGPAGLTAAHDLAKMGFGVTVYEALPVPGGMMRVGIPAHRLPKGVLQKDIDDILALGIILKTNSPIGNPKKLLEEGYAAVCLATGVSSRDHSLGLEGEDSEGVMSAATFLRKINLGEPIQIGNRVAVVGGGITALDAAAVARRLGAEVHLAIDRPRGELPAYQWEVNAIEAEGIHLHERTTLTRILELDGKVIGVELAETKRGMIKDQHGRRRPKIASGTEFTLEVDTVIGTNGQFSDLNFLEPRFDDLDVDSQLFVSEIPGLFVIGGRKTGASYIIEAVALGHRVAQSIEHYLEGQKPINSLKTKPLVSKPSRDELVERVRSGTIRSQPRTEPSLIPMEERVTSFREVVLGFTELQARNEAQRCLQCGICSECMACVYTCGVDAIDHDMVLQEEQIRVGAVILAPGFQTYNATLSEEYGYGRYPNVITALDFERMLSASGPTTGQILRPSNTQKPQKIAFLQCIGSRDQSHDYCSAICCMYATKEAIMAKEHHPELDIHVFMMDMRAFSKGYWAYFERAQKKYGVQYTRCRVSNLTEDRDSHDLIIKYQDKYGEIKFEKFDLIVLSVGMEISESVRALGNRLGIELDEYGFCHTVQFNPIETSRKGIFAVGPFREPKDIPESVIEASGAAAAAASHVSSSRNTLTTQLEYPPEKDVLGEEPRIGVFVCHCGSNIAGYLDVEDVKEYSKTLPNVVHTETNLYACSQDSIQHITTQIQDLGLNRVVVASCTPLTHQPIFQDSVRAAGLNPYLFEMANIRNQCSWVHSNNWKVATQKAKELVRMAVGKAALLEPQNIQNVQVNHNGLVVGGGVAGMTAALSLADQGFPVTLVEKEGELGGNLKSIYIPSNHLDPQRVLKDLIQQVSNHPLISIKLNSQVIRTDGFAGNFTSIVQSSNCDHEKIHHGVSILAIGAREYRGSDYDFGLDPRVITLQQLENQIAHSETQIQKLKSVAFIQCVGPAEKYCSRICCTSALKNALELRKIKPGIQVSILYRDIRTYGFKERLYSSAREQGVTFIRYVVEKKPQIIDNDPLTVRVWDIVLNRPIDIQLDLLVLSMPIVPNPDASQVAALFKVPLDSDGFFLESHVKLRPVDFNTEGVFMAGLAHYPKLLDETIIQAQAAAGRAARILSQETMSAGGRVAVVDETRCTGCLTCVRICPFNVPIINPSIAGTGNIFGVATIEPAICRGCGSCAAECPANAIQLMHYTDAQMQAKIGALLNPEINFLPVEKVPIRG